MNQYQFADAVYLSSPFLAARGTCTPIPCIDAPNLLDLRRAWQSMGLRVGGGEVGREGRGYEG